MPRALGHALGQNFLENFEFPRGIVPSLASLGPPPLAIITLIDAIHFLETVDFVIKNKF